MAGIERDVAGGVVAFTAALALLACVGPALRDDGEVVTTKRPCMVRVLWSDPAGQPLQLYRGTIPKGTPLRRLPGPPVMNQLPARSLDDPRLRGFVPDLCLP